LGAAARTPEGNAVEMLDYPADYRFEVRQGSTITRNFQLSIDDSPVNLTGYTARMQVRDRPESNAVVLNATPYITLGGTAGDVAISIPASISEDLPAGRFTYDLELVQGDYVTALIKGPFVVRAEVTRD